MAKKKLSYSTITREYLEKEFGLEFLDRSIIPEDIEGIKPSEYLIYNLSFIKHYVPKNEKFQSEIIIIPILNEIWTLCDGKFKLYSGEPLNVDASKGLIGELDFGLSTNLEASTIKSPIISIVEAKKEQFENGIIQGSAQLIAAKLFNESQKHPLKELWGCSSNGREWFFFKLEDNKIIRHTKGFSIDNLPVLLGIWKWIVERCLAEGNQCRIQQ